MAPRVLLSSSSSAVAPSGLPTYINENSGWANSGDVNGGAAMSLPTDTQEGDMVLAIVSWNSGSDQTTTGPTGFSPAPGFFNVMRSNGPQIWAWYKIMDASDISSGDIDSWALSGNVKHTWHLVTARNASYINGIKVNHTDTTTPYPYPVIPLDPNGSMNALAIWVATSNATSSLNYCGTLVSSVASTSSGAVTTVVSRSDHEDEEYAEPDATTGNGSAHKTAGIALAGDPLVQWQHSAGVFHHNNYPRLLEYEGVPYWGSTTPNDGQYAATDNTQTNLSSTSQDDHLAPAVAFGSDGVPQYFWARHNNDAYVRQYVGNDGDGSIDSFASEVQVQMGGSGAAYTNVWQQDGSIYLLSRVDDEDWWLNVSNDDGATWNGGIQLFDFSANKHYMCSMLDSGSNKIHIGYYEWSGSDTDAYYVYIDLTDGSIHSADGTSLGNIDGTSLPLLDTEPDVFTGAANSGFRVVAVAETANPCLVLADVDGADTAYLMRRWNGSSWDSSTILSAVGEVQSGHPCGACFAPGVDNEVYLARYDAGNDQYVLDRYVTADYTTWTKDAEILRFNHKIASPSVTANHIAFTHYGDLDNYDDFRGDVFVFDLADLN